MTSFINETRERFLVAIAAQVPAEQIEEIHFFAPIKQGGVESGVAVVAAKGPTPESEKLVIYTARYRLTLKGPDRGKWETNVVAEADAPLITVEAVVRGVQRRSGDVDDPAKMEGDEVRSIMEARAAAAAAPGVVKTNP